MKRLLLAGSMLVIGVCAGKAADPTGVWLRDEGDARVQIKPCGAVLCGKIVWLKDASGPARVGQKVLFDMKSSGADKWSGHAFNPEDGQTYFGTMTISGNSLKTSGCVLGGLICLSVSWSRYK